MAANKLRLTSLKLFQRYNFCNTYAALRKSLYCTTKPGNPENSEPTDQKKSGFSNFDKKQTELLEGTETLERAEPTSERKSGFVKFDEKQSELLRKIEKPEEEEKPPASFVSLLRNSAFVQLGDPVDKVVIGKIYRVVDRDLYIDFGWKFPTVCTAPERNRDLYVVGAKVRLLIKDLELASKFLGGDEEITLNEADCVLLGVYGRQRNAA